MITTAEVYQQRWPSEKTHTMIQPAFLAFELLPSILFLLCLWHAMRRGNSRASELCFAVLFGVFLEWMTIQQLNAYQYGQFLVMIHGAPLWIGVGWAVIIYSGMVLLENWHMPNFARPFMVGFFALNLDIALDVVAIRQGFWHWTIPLNSQWHGVPWGNFWAWFIVVSSYSGLLYWLRSQGYPNANRWWLRGLYPLGAVLGSVVILGVTNTMFLSLLATDELLSASGMLLLFMIGAVIIYVVRPEVKDSARLEPVMMAIPLVSHTGITMMGFAGGFYQAAPILAVIGFLMFALMLGFILWPWWRNQE
jgi:hypothetical protein